MKVSSVIFLLLLGAVSFAQGDIDYENKTLIRNERSFYFLLNTNGGGVGYSMGKMINIYRKNLWNFEIAKIKDAKEVKLSSNSGYRRYVYGKTHDFFVTRAGYGYLHNLYKKKDKGGIEINYFYNAGLSLGVLKPMYYYVKTNTGDNVEKFDKNVVPTVLGGASYFKGFNELSLVPGAYFKLGASFEFSKRDMQLNALEGGLLMDVFPQEIEILANNNNQFYFFSLFISYRFGKIINPRAKKKSSIDLEEQ